MDDYDIKDFHDLANGLMTTVATKKELIEHREFFSKAKKVMFMGNDGILNDRLNYMEIYEPVWKPRMGYTIYNIAGIRVYLLDYAIESFIDVTNFTPEQFRALEVFYG